MSYFIVFLLLFPIYIHASEVSIIIPIYSYAKEEAKPQETTLTKEETLSKNDTTYEDGLKFYKNRDFKNAYRIFSKIYLDKLSDVYFNFYLGKSAYETGHYEIALAAFERVEIQDSTNIKNKLEIARTYFMLKMYKESEMLFQEVLDNPELPQSVRKNIELSLSQVAKVQEKSFTYATVMFNKIYDSNVNYGSLGDYEYGGGTLNQIKTIDDTANQAYINITNIYDIGKSGGFAVKNSFSFFAKDYDEQDFYDVMYFSYNPSLLYTQTKYLSELVLGVDSMTLNSKNYLSTLSIMPRLEYKHSNTLKSILHFKYQVKKFEQEAQKDLDANRMEVVYGLQNILSPRSYFQINLATVNEKSIRGQNIYVDFSEYKINTMYANQFSSNFSFDFFLQTRLRAYKDKSTGFGNVRDDIGGLGSIGLTMKILPTLRVKIKASYEYVDSNQDRFSYDKKTVSAGLIKSF